MYVIINADTQNETNINSLYHWHFTETHASLQFYQTNTNLNWFFTSVNLTLIIFTENSVNSVIL